MAFTIGGTPPNLTAVGVDSVGVTDSLHVVDGYRMAEGAVAVIDPGVDFARVDTMTDPVGVTDTQTVGTTGSTAATASGSLTLTGSATAVDASAGNPTVMVTVLPDARAARVTVDDLGGDTAVVWRSDGTTAAPVQVRLAVIIESSQTLAGIDYEAPMDVPLTYSAVVDGTTYTAAPVTIPSFGRDWYTALGQPSLSRPITVESFPALTHGLAHSRVRPLNSRNPLIITHARLGGEGVLTLLTMTYSEAQAVRALIDLSPLFQFKTPPDRDIPGGVMYLLAGDYSEERVIDAANEPTRRFVIDVVEVDRPPLEVTPPDENTWQDWMDEEIGNSTWAAWTSKSWLDLLIETMVGS